MIKTIFSNRMEPSGGSIAAIRRGGVKARVGSAWEKWAALGYDAASEGDDPEIAAGAYSSLCCLPAIGRDHVKRAFAQGAAIFAAQSGSAQS